MSLYCGIACRRKSLWCYRLLSTYVTKTRYLLELKEDDDACKTAQQTGAFYLFHSLAPLLQKSEHQYLAPQHSLSELEKLLAKFGQDTQRIEDSVLLGCSEKHEAWFALDLVLNSSSPINGESLEEAVRREVAEEVGLEVERLQYSASQHWPFPNSSLMIACHATVKPGQTEIQVNLRELEAAAWFSHDEVATALRRNNPYTQQQNGTFPFWLPPKLAIAHQLIKEWVEKPTCSALPA
uniref:NAD(+) diphosphatase n=1 Tax=Equus caballus TaxID=9796 RepID=A0A9L0R3B3_HORSE